MAKISFPATHVSAYAGEVSDLRVVLSKLKSFLEKSPGATAEIKAQIAAFNSAMSWNAP